MTASNADDRDEPEIDTLGARHLEAMDALFALGEPAVAALRELIAGGPDVPAAVRLGACQLVLRGMGLLPSFAASAPEDLPGDPDESDLDRAVRESLAAEDD